MRWLSSLLYLLGYWLDNLLLNVLWDLWLNPIDSCKVKLVCHWKRNRRLNQFVLLPLNVVWTEGWRINDVLLKIYLTRLLEPNRWAFTSRHFDVFILSFWFMILFVRFFLCCRLVNTPVVRHLLILIRWSIAGVSKHVRYIQLLHCEFDVRWCKVVALAMSHYFLGLLYNLQKLVSHVLEKRLQNLRFVDLIWIHSNRFQKSAE